MKIASWKTFSAGVVTIVGSVTGLVFAIKNKSLNEGVITGCATGILTGLGLVFARDNNVSSVDVGIQGVTTNAAGQPVVSPIGPDTSSALKDKLNQK